MPWTGDNPSSLIGTGIIHDRVVAVSLGTSDTVFALTTEPAGQSSHVFRSPTGDFMSLVCFRNGSLARDWVRTEYGLDWDAVAAVLEKQPGNDGWLMLPWLEAEITPRVAHAGLRRFGFDRVDAERNVRGLIEGQMMAIANHAAAVSRTIDRVIATGGAAVNRAILQVMANVFGVDVDRLDVEQFRRARRGAARLSRRSTCGRRAGVMEDGRERLHRAETGAPRLAESKTRRDVRRSCAATTRCSKRCTRTARLFADVLQGD